jgi:hypothetical protein
MIRAFGTNDTGGLAHERHAACCIDGGSVAMMPVGKRESHSTNINMFSVIPNPRTTQKHTGSNPPVIPPSQDPPGRRAATASVTHGRGAPGPGGMRRGPAVSALIQGLPAEGLPAGELSSKRLSIVRSSYSSALSTRSSSSTPYHRSMLTAKRQRPPKRGWQRDSANSSGTPSERARGNPGNSMLHGWKTSALRPLTHPRKP